MPTASIEVEIPGKAHIVSRSLGPEVKIARATVHLSHTDTSMTLTIDAPDSVALRAALNSFLRWIEVAVEVQDLVNQWDSLN